MSTRFSRRAVVGTLVVAGSALAGATLHAGFVTTERAFAADPAPVTRAAPVPPTAVAGLSDAFADLADRVTPSVVQIEVLVSPDEAPAQEMQIPEEFRRFFDMPRGFQNPEPDQPMRGGGSGFLISSDGYIVTNNHVVGDAEKISVTLNDRRAFDADLVGTDPTTDVAVIKIDAKDLPFLDWGSSDALRVGEWVMAVGNPGFGGGQLDYTVTTGIVSAKDRPLRLIGRDLELDPRYGQALSGYAIENFIQTDAVINPGNSGGPLVDMAGRVVGVNSAIASTDGHYQGYGFAIPADLIRKVAADLIQYGSVRRPWLGVQVAQVSPEDAEAYHLPRVSGVLVQGVTEDGPAADAGMRQGDVIVSVGDRAVTSGGELQELIAIQNQGDKVLVGFYRDGTKKTAEIRLGAAPVNGAEASSPASRHGGSATSTRLGFTVRPLDAETAGALGYAAAEGVVVAQVDPTGPSAGKGIVGGLRVVRIGSKEIHTPADVTQALEKVDAGHVVTILLQTPSGDTRIANVRTR
jgi:serine protease Do